MNDVLYRTLGPSVLVRMGRIARVVGWAALMGSVAACGSSSPAGNGDGAADLADGSLSFGDACAPNEVNACGTCGAYCFDVSLVGVLGEGAVRITADDADNPSGRPGVTLEPPVHGRDLHLWAANHTDNTVSKFNTGAETEEGIYWVGVDPSRTAVDLDGNCWVASRGDGRLTKIIGDTETCPDRNKNGVVDTSRNHEGVVARVNSEDDPLADECVAYSAVPNPERTNIRGLAVGPDGTVWIGYSSGGIQPIDPRTLKVGPFYENATVPLWELNADGVLADSGKTVEVNELTAAGRDGAYGLVVDANGLLYQANNVKRDRLPVFDTVKREWVAVYQRASNCSYGLAIDSKNRVWTGTHPDCTGVGMFDPTAKRFYTFAVPEAAEIAPGATATASLVSGGGGGGKETWDTTGVAVEPASGDVWTSFWAQGYTGRLHVDEADLAKSRWTFIGTTKASDGSQLQGFGTDLRGVGFDHLGFAWTLGLGGDRIFKLDPATNARASSLPEGKSIGVGSHYTYSDFTGSTLFHFTAPGGTWRHTFTAECYEIEGIGWQAHVPPGATVGIRLRASGADGDSWVPDAARDAKKYFEYLTGATQRAIDLRSYADQLKQGPFELEVWLAPSKVGALPILHTVEIIGSACLH